jgi:hypothetical protein
MVEIDTPGHSSIIFKSHPEHIACPEATPWPSFAGGMCAIHSENNLVKLSKLSGRTSCWPAEAR